MIHALALILICQLAGETATRALALPVPGPVMGMGLMLGLLMASARVRDIVTPTAQGILRHLSLLFVPAGVGLIGHLDRLGPQAAALGLAIVASTALAMVVGALTFVALAKMTGARDD
jgi:holin-like protein